MIHDFWIGLRCSILLWIVTAFLYPALILGIGQGVFPYQANGSLLTRAQGSVLGSALIGQTFTGDRYFWSRPSTTNYSTGEQAGPTGVSGASNLAPDNPDLWERIQTDARRLKTAGTAPTADLLYASGSGLDPHISPIAARAQIDRVAKARSQTPEQIRILVDRHTESRFLGIFGEPAVNVLLLNSALDQS
ncbi:MAG: K(+)-transporting ATPase subunit C [Oscillatoriales cyanobacterium SM2_2_1]|nr:K(+)-transporting ATPase subunit C [Oscillatoriales cyanobacterium SM2_2_1]